MNTGRWFLGLLLSGHLALALALGVFNPLFEMPDEAGHFLYVRYLLAYRRLPVQGHAFDAPRAHHPPGYYLLGAWLTAAVDLPGSPDAIQTRINPHFGFRLGEPGHDNKAAFIHHGPDERWPYQGQALAVHLLRALSAGFSLFAVWLTYLTARELQPAHESLALLAAGLVAFNLMVLFMSGQVNNDTAGLAGGAAVSYMLVRAIRQGFSARRWLGVGLVLALSLLFKSSVLSLVAPVVVTLGWEAWRRRSWAVLLVGGLSWVGPILLLMGWWFGRNYMLYGDVTANTAVLWVSGLAPPDGRWAQALLGVPGFLKGLLGGLMVVPTAIWLPDGFYWAAAGLMRVAVAGLTRLAFRKWPSVVRLTPAIWPWMMLGLMVAGGLASAVAVMWVGRSIWFGRYLFPVFTPLVVLVAAGWLNWSGPRLRPLWAGGLVALNLSVALYGWVGLLIPTYRIPPTPSVVELRAMTPLEATIGEVARVLGYRLDKDTVRGGEVLAVTVYWQALAQTETPYSVFIHLYEPSVGSLGQRDTYPGLGNYATIAWDAGRTFVDTYRLYLADDLPAVAEAHIVLGLYDEQTGQRLPVSGADAGSADEAWVRFGQIQVTP